MSLSATLRQSLSGARERGVTVLQGGSVEQAQWPELLDDAERLATAAIPDETPPLIGVVAETSLDFLRSVLSVWLSERAVVLLSPEDSDHTGRLKSAGATVVLDAKRSSFSAYPATRSGTVAQSVANDAIRLVQFTSGTTGDPRPVLVRSDALIEHIADVASRLGIEGGSRVYVWIPLYHDLGLIAQCLAALYVGADLVLRSTVDFVARPSLLLDDATAWKITMTASPSVGLGMVARSARRSSRLDKWSLDSLSCVAVAADVVREVDIDAFVGTSEPFGFNSQSLLAGYGMAEAIVGVTCGALGSGIRFVPPPDSWAIESSMPVAQLGEPIGDVEISIDEQVAMRGLVECSRLGTISLKGSNVVGSDYGVRWMRTSDVGGMVDGQLAVIGRIDDVINLGGAKYSPYGIEAAAEGVPGIRRGNVAAVHVASTQEGDPGQVVVFAETEGPSNELQLAVRAAVRRSIGDIPIQVKLVPPRSLPKTSSGKVRRGDCRAWG